ncbi:MAG: deoxyribodipyrimidine photolyase [Planctomycetota bacterium]
MPSKVPDLRIQRLNHSPLNGRGDYVLYWMTASRRLRWNFALDRALEYCRETNLPLLIFEPLRCDYRWASRRLHAFIIRGMADNAATAAESGHAYIPWVEPEFRAGEGLIEAVSANAAVVITDDYPCFFLPQMIRAVAGKIGVRLETVDSNGLLPMRAAEQVFPTAYAFRRYLQKSLTPHLQQFPAENPLADRSIPRLAATPSLFSGRWSPTPAALLAGQPALLDRLPVDQSVREGIARGGVAAGTASVQEFLRRKLARYGEDRNHPDADGGSGLSPWLHFGHVSVHQLFTALKAHEGWTAANLGDPKETRGGRSGWWGMSDAAESFLDELVTWRELGFNMCSKVRHFDRWDSLPDWAQQTLDEHLHDPRPYTYSLEQLQQAATHDPVWNAAQRQLLEEGRMHNYLRMLWGKKVLEWSPTPQHALQVLIELNNRFAVDGRDPNSYSGIFWVFGRYDRAWGPERKIYGKIRYMTSDNTVKKLDMQNYLRKWGAKPGQRR